MFLKNCYDLASLKRKRSSHIYSEKAWTTDIILAWLFLAGMNILPRSVQKNLIWIYPCFSVDVHYQSTQMSI